MDRSTMKIHLRVLSGIAPAQRAQLLGDLIDEVDLLQVIGR